LGNHIAEQLLVKPKAHVSEAELQGLIRNHGAMEISRIHQINVRLLHVPEERLSTVLSALQNNPSIEFAEPNYILSPNLIPDDPYYPSEWHLAKINAPAAWDVTVGTSNVVIAILDSGVDATHPDLSSLVIPGWNFYDNNSDATDVNGHGTAVAGTAAASSNNSIGVAAVTWNPMLLPVRVTDTNGNGLISVIANGLTWAADQGARVANISFTVSTSPTVTSAAQYFQSKGGVLTAAAGNNGLVYSSADNPYILTVSATDANDLIATWSTTGSNIDLCAPGVGILTTARGGGYASASGTSFAAPIVAGVAALVMSANPALSGTDVQDILKQNADDLGTTGWDITYGYGRVNAYKAVLAAMAVTSTNTAPVVNISSPASGSVVSNTVAVNIAATASQEIAVVELLLGGVCVSSNSTSSAVFSWNTTDYTNGSYALQAIAYDLAGHAGTSAVVSVTVLNRASDTTPPLVGIARPASDSTLVGAVSVQVTATDSLGVTNVEWYLNSALMGSSSSASASFSWNTAAYSNGSYTLLAKGYDVAGNVGSSATVAVAVQNPVPDTTPPTVQILSPASGATLSGANSINVTSSDNVGVTSVEWYLDGILAGSSNSPAPAFFWNTATAANGSHTLLAKAYDAAGNVSTPATVTVNVQNTTSTTTPPAVKITSPGNSSSITQKTTKVYASTSDSVGVVRADLIVDGKFYTSLTVSPPATTWNPVFNWNTSKLARGSHTLQSAAYDSAGNTNRSVVVTVFK
jgi:subtilisin family serine protease